MVRLLFNFPSGLMRVYAQRKSYKSGEQLVLDDGRGDGGGVDGRNLMEHN